MFDVYEDGGGHVDPKAGNLKVGHRLDLSLGKLVRRCLGWLLRCFEFPDLGGGGLRGTFLINRFIYFFLKIVLFF